jgi:hypothetical protein
VVVSVRSSDVDCRFFVIVIVFVAAEKYEITRCLVALGPDGYDNPILQLHSLDGLGVRFQNGDTFGRLSRSPRRNRNVFFWVVGVIDRLLISLCRCRGCQNGGLGHDRFVGLERRCAVWVPQDAGR